MKSQPKPSSPKPSDPKPTEQAAEPKEKTIEESTTLSPERPTSPKGDVGASDASAVGKNKDIVGSTAATAPSQASIIHVSLY